MYGKLVNNLVEFAPNPIFVEDKQIYNARGSLYEQLGYKEIIYTTPLEPMSGYRVVEDWSEVNDKIVQGWHYEEDSELAAEEALEIILGE